jgi:hypothetical protein
VTHRALTIEAVLFLPEFAGLFVAKGGRLMSVLAVQALVARRIVKEVTIVEIFRKFHLENLLLTSK